ncbi:MAG: GDP-mannose 4,6-dehydratase [Candidatus Rifleibacteriota bacterium]
MNKKKLLIFGSGFICSHIVQTALNKDMRVEVLYNKHPIESGLSLKYQHCLSNTDIRKFLRDFSPDFIISLQGNSFVPDNKVLRESIETNLIVPLSYLEEVANYSESAKNLSKVIIIGSAGEYGRTYHEPISENFPLHPSSIYGLTKIFLFNTALYYMEKGLPIIYTRQFNCTGPGQRNTFLIPSICFQIAKIENGLQDSKIEIGDLTQERDFIDVRDAVEAYFTILSNGTTGQVYNIGSGICRSVQSVLEETIKISEIDSNKVEISVKEALFFKEQSISNRVLANNSRLTKLGFQAKIPFSTTLKDTLEYWRKHVKTQI